MLQKRSLSMCDKVVMTSPKKLIELLIRLIELAIAITIFMVTTPVIVIILLINYLEQVFREV